MSRIQINDLNFNSEGLRDLSDEELLIIQGGGWFYNLTGISTPNWIAAIDDYVHDKLGGWVTVINTVYKLYRSSGTGNTQLP
jgi:hypothetical protein